MSQMIHPRDRAVVQLVARFRQASAAQVAALLFGGLSAAPANRALRRLTDRGYLARVERRLSGGSHGGSGQYIYALGPLGYRLYYESRYRPPRTVNNHALVILDVYIALKNKHIEKSIYIDGMSTEPDCHRQVGRYFLKPDLYLDMRRPDGQRRLYWFEIDMGTESQSRIREKLARYWQAYNHADESDWSIWPMVVFVAVDKERAEELAWLVKQGPEETRRLFRVATLETLRAAEL